MEVSTSRKHPEKYSQWSDSYRYDCSFGRIHSFSSALKPWLRYYWSISNVLSSHTCAEKLTPRAISPSTTFTQPCFSYTHRPLFHILDCITSFLVFLWQFLHRLVHPNVGQYPHVIVQISFPNLFFPTKLSKQNYSTTPKLQMALEHEPI